MKSPAYSLINILVLSVGLTSAILVSLYVQDELSFDKHWSDGERIYRLGTIRHMPDGSGAAEFKDTYVSVAPKLSTVVPQAEYVSRYVLMRFLVTYQNRRFYEEIRFSDHTFFNVFDMRFLEGSREKAFEKSYSVVLTESTARKYFGDESALGKTIQFDVKHQFTVGGVIEDPTENTHLELGLIANIESRKRMYGKYVNDNWKVPFASTYVKLQQDENIQSIESSLRSFAKQHVPPHLDLEFTLLPVSDIHVNESAVGGQGNLAILSITVLLILLMVCINTVNLSTAKGVERNKELGVRKALGASRMQIAFLILSESILLSLAALLVALFSVEMLIAVFNAITDKSLSFNYLTDIGLLLQLILISLFTGVCAGAYPAFILSSFKPVDVFRSSSKFGTGSVNVRKLLLIIQFAVAIGLSVFSIVIFKQLQFMKNMDLGFDKENIVVVHNLDWTDIRGKNNSLITELESNPDILYVAESTEVPGKDIRSTIKGFFPLGSSKENALSINHLMIGYDFFDAYNVNLRAGRYFSEEFGSDELVFEESDMEDASESTFNIILNESAVKKLGLHSAEQSIGKIIRTDDPDWPFSLKVAGVVSDFHMLAGHGKIEPYIFLLKPDRARFISVRTKTGSTMSALKHIDNVWSKINPEYPIVRSFLDSDLEKSYGRWEKNGQLMGVLVFITITISVIGSYTLSAFSIRLRNKEICMRKLAGAQALDITKLFCMDFSKPMLIANAIAMPFAYYFSYNWLSEFSYRIELSPVMFLIVFIASITLCFASISFNTVRVANTNLAKTLKNL
ncbi:ABC transporter permease [Pseudoalteromonas umbrosa]|uniref:ABC transporter permease n=1 Tax=Pseudoalteromonas umbrosa TaxID=3048489 RepID=UPI0024C31E6A|nr:ABC transporter permease [Pseudoalteromonas sp. B95]MDK1288228.1 ABC transporter permease [Pseudoalteromonas sp. B95]